MHGISNQHHVSFCILQGGERRNRKKNGQWFSKRPTNNVPWYVPQFYVQLVYRAMYSVQSHPKNWALVYSVLNHKWIIKSLFSVDTTKNRTSDFKDWAAKKVTIFNSIFVYWKLIKVSCFLYLHFNWLFCSWNHQRILKK